MASQFSSALLCAVVAAAAASYLSACGGNPVPSPNSALDPSHPAAGRSADRPVDTLETKELKAGSGAAITAGQTAVVQYTGWLYETSAPDNKGKEFDSSRRTGEPFRFRLGAGQVIKGWDQGVSGMQPGGSRRLTIPADLAYGDMGASGVIPPGATLVFDIDLVAVE